MSFDLFQIRRELHQIPEIAFQEKRTKELLLGYLKQLEGIRIHELKDNYGILAEYSHADGKYRLFRSDMDALPISENTGCCFKSQNVGVMHACGHDVHMTILLGLIERICFQKPKTNLLFLFQPAEEGMGGAESVLAEGIIQSYPVESVFALHVYPDLPVGTVSSKAGIFFGVPQEFDVVFTGKPAHAAFPRQGVNALSAGREFLRLMDEDIRDLATREMVIFHVGKMSSGNVRNIVPDRCVLEGTQRSLSKGVSKQINDLILKNCALAAEKTRAHYEVDFLRSYDPVVNDAGLADRLRQVCEREKFDYQVAQTVLTGEDFGFFTTLYPGLLFWLGAGSGHPLHSDKFLPQEECIPVGIRMMESLALYSY
jgi:N-acetyldiaminopimelate deacetylase